MCVEEAFRLAKRLVEGKRVEDRPRDRSAVGAATNAGPASTPSASSGLGRRGHPMLEQLRIPPTESEFRKRQLRNYHRCRSHPTRAVRPQAELRTQGERVPWNLSNVGSRRFSWMGAAVGNCKLIEAYCCFRSAFPAFPSRRSGSGCGRHRFSRERPSTLRSIRAGSAPGQMGGQGSAKRRDRQGPAVDWTRLGRGTPMAKVNLGFAGSK